MTAQVDSRPSSIRLGVLLDGYKTGCSVSIIHLSVHESISPSPVDHEDSLAYETTALALHLSHPLYISLPINKQPDQKCLSLLPSCSKVLVPSLYHAHPNPPPLAVLHLCHVVSSPEPLSILYEIPGELGLRSVKPIQEPVDQLPASHLHLQSFLCRHKRRRG